MKQFVLSGVLAFTAFFSYTQCVPQATINDDFESYTAGSSAGLPTCWKSIAPALVMMGVRSDAADANSGVQFVNIYTFFSSNAVVYLISPELSSIDGNHFAEFYVKTAYPDVTVEYGSMSSNTDAATFVSAGTGTIGNNVHTLITTSAIPATAGHKYFAIKFTAPTAHSGIKIDDFSWDQISSPACNEVQNLSVSSITHNGAQLNWTGSTGNTYSVEYGPTGFTPGNGSSISSATETTTLGGLQQNTTYDVYVTTLCSGTNSNATQTSFTTLANTVSVSEYTSNNNLRLYPNPATGNFVYLKVDTETNDYTITAYNTVGKVIAISMAGQPIQTGTWASGLYLIEAKNESSTHLLKLIVP